MYDRATGAQKKATDAVNDITRVMMQIPDLEKQIDSMQGSGGGGQVPLDSVTNQGKMA